jgi:hypothetical protein
MRYRIFVILFVSIFVAWIASRFMSVHLASSTPSKLTLIPIEDRPLFLSHFRTLLTSNLGFTLIGSKPLALEEFSQYRDLSENPQITDKFIKYLDLIFKDSPRFSLRWRGSKKNGILNGFFLVDKRAFEQLNEDPNQPFVFETMKIGKLFGYGEKNTRFYLRYTALTKYLRKPPIVHSLPFAIIPVDPTTPLYFKVLKFYSDVKIPKKVKEPPQSLEFASLEEEWKFLDSNKTPLLEWCREPLWISKPIYVSWQGPETDALDRHYEEAANRLGELLHDERWFDRVMAIIDGTSPEANNLVIPPST